MRRCLFLILPLALAGCGLGLQPLPEQRPAPAQEDPPDYRFFVRMNVPSANPRIVRDIGVSPAEFRWTGERPAVKVTLPDSGEWVARIEFAIAEATLKDTGPVTVAVSLNGRPLGEGRYEQAGEQALQFPVPPDWFPAGGEATLQAHVHPVWVAPSDGAKLGVLLRAMGFLRP